MSSKAKKEYLLAIKQRYRCASKKERSALLNEVCLMCGFNRKYAIRVLNAPDNLPAKKKSGRPKRYVDPLLVDVLIRLLKASNLICSKRLKQIIPLWLPHLEAAYHITLPHEIKQQILSISAATIDRLVASSRRKWKKIGFCTTKPGSLIKKHVPVKTDQWNERKPGFIEADTVAHCGNSVSGQFAYSVNTVDIATGWIETRAVWGKGQQGVFSAIESIESALPMPIVGFDADNGGEFLNWHFLKYFTHRKRPVAYTRSRSYQKNDNAHIEGKNYTHIRQYLGYSRFESPKIVPLLNDLYTNEWSLFFNFFIPSSKIIAKDRIDGKIFKRHDIPQTPFQRLCNSPDISAKVVARLKRSLDSLNPFLLQELLADKIKRILQLATPEGLIAPSLINISTKKEKK
jgi:hypothetical protein